MLSNQSPSRRGEASCGPPPPTLITLEFVMVVMVMVMMMVIMPSALAWLEFFHYSRGRFWRRFANGFIFQCTLGQVARGFRRGFGASSQAPTSTQSCGEAHWSAHDPPCPPRWCCRHRLAASSRLRLAASGSAAEHAGVLHQTFLASHCGGRPLLQREKAR